MQNDPEIQNLLQSKGETVWLTLASGRLAASFRKGTGKCRGLIISFHGAVDRKTRELPAFVPFFAGFEDSSHQLSVSDPSMLVDGEHPMAWYAGHQGADMQAQLCALFARISAALAVDRVIYLGTSGGGFAALYYSWQHPGSLVLVGNPQTRIEDYYSGHVKKYKSACWPDLPADAPLGQVTCENVRSLYAQSVPNTVVYVQNPTDHFHLFNHMVPFLAGITEKGSRERILLDVAYSGKVGHSPTWPKLRGWLQAAFAAPSWNQDDLQTTHHALSSDPSAPPEGAAPDTRKSAALSPADLRMADLLRDLHLKS